MKIASLSDHIPVFHELDLLERHGKKIQLIKRITGKWERVATRLYFPVTWTLLKSSAEILITDVIPRVVRCSAGSLMGKVANQGLGEHLSLFSMKSIYHLSLTSWKK